MKPEEHLCPECFTHLVKGYPSRTKKGRVIRYRRFVCRSCDYYEAIPFGNDNSVQYGHEDSKIESVYIREKIEEDIAEKRARYWTFKTKYNTNGALKTA